MMSEVVVSDPLKVAAAKALRAHHALGRLSACATSSEFSEAAAEFLDLARSVSQTIARYGKGTSSADSSEARRSFAYWLGEQVAGLLRHPLVTELTASRPTVYVSRVARGSGPPPFREAITIARVPTPVKQRVEEFFFDGADKRPAIELCAEYLDRVTGVLDEARLRMKRLGLESTAS